MKIADLTPEEPSNIVSITGNPEMEIELAPKEHNKWPCPSLHKQVVVDSVNRTVTCKHCGFAVDPFKYLEQWANEGDRRMTRLKDLDVQIRIHRTELDDLEYRLSSIRQKLKRAGDPQTPAERMEFSMKKNNPKRLSVLENTTNPPGNSDSGA